MTKYKILVLTGGGIDERDVSLRTAENVSSHLRKMGHLIEVVDVGQVELITFLQNINEKPDLVFNCLHGTFGEDGKVQAILDYFGLKYTHSNFFASAIGMNKRATYYLAESIGVVCPLSHFLSFSDYQKKEFLGHHICKPIDNGSSVGVFLVKSAQDKDMIKKYSNEVMIQEYIPGIELTVTVLCGSAISCAQLEFDYDIFSESCKYSGLSRYSLFANEEVRKLAYNWSEKIYDLVGCSGVARVDFRYDPNVDGNRGLYFLEVNTQPGLSTMSIVPQMLNKMGIPFEDFLKILIEDVMNRD